MAQISVVSGKSPGLAGFAGPSQPECRHLTFGQVLANRLRPLLSNAIDVALFNDIFFFKVAVWTYDFASSPIFSALSS
jgi:hypothetical protein